MSNEEQVEYWNGEAGERWAQADDNMARILQPVCQALLDHATPEGCVSALDVGCGGGSQSLMLARRLGSQAKVLGVDISGPLLEVARGKVTDGDAASLSFLQADASDHPFEPGSFDLLFSRFGVMFFDDPVGAFSHMRKALRPGARLAFCCWQAMMANDWTRIPLQAALQHVAPPEAPDPHAPGPFAFADPERLRDILQSAGFEDIQLVPFNREVRFSEAPSLKESVRELAMIGPVSRLLAEQEPEVVERVLVAMEEVMAPFYQDGGLAMPAAIWFVTGRAG